MKENTNATRSTDADGSSGPITHSMMGNGSKVTWRVTAPIISRKTTLTRAVGRPTSCTDKESIPGPTAAATLARTSEESNKATDATSGRTAVFMKDSGLTGGSMARAK